MVLILLLVLPLAIWSLYRDMAELAGKIRRALAFVPGSALSSIHARQVADHHTEVLRCQSVSGMAIFTNKGGGVPLLAAVVALSFRARHFADGGREDHLDTARVVSDLESGSR